MIAKSLTGLLLGLAAMALAACADDQTGELIGPPPTGPEIEEPGPAD